MFQFFFEQKTVSSLESFHDLAPSLFSLETLEPCVLWWVARVGVYRMLHERGEVPELREQLAGFFFDRTRHYLAYCVFYLRNSPKQRY